MLRRFFNSVRSFVSSSFLTVLLCVAALILPVASLHAQTEVLRVDIVNGTTTGDGSDWGPDAIKYLQDALVRADVLLEPPSNITLVEIWVAQGTYRPDQGQNETLGDRSAVFEMRDNVQIYGHFAGTESNLSERDLDNPAYETILSGDLYEDDFESDELDFDPRAGHQPRGGSPRGAAIGAEACADRHAARVVGGDDDDADAHDRMQFLSTVVHAAAHINQTAVIDGFIIRTSRGHAMVIDDAQPRVSNGTFRSDSGHAAVRLRGNAEVVFNRCAFEIIHVDPIAADDAARYWCVE